MQSCRYWIEKHEYKEGEWEKLVSATDKDDRESCQARRFPTDLLINRLLSWPPSYSRYGAQDTEPPASADRRSPSRWATVLCFRHQARLPCVFSS